MANFAEMQSWHRQQISSVIAQNSQVREIKQQIFGRDLHGRAAYTMFLESQHMEPFESLDYLTSVGYFHVTSCVVGTWLETHRGEVNRPTFPIDAYSLRSMYTLFKDFKQDSTIPTGRRNSLQRLLPLGIVRNRGRIITEADFPLENFDPGIRLPLGLLFERVLEGQIRHMDADDALPYQLGFDLGVSRWRELTTVA